MYTLGISGFAHEAACALVCDGRVCALIEQERINREKHTSAFPLEAIQTCMEIEEISASDVEEIGFFWNPNREMLGNLGFALRHPFAAARLLKTPSGGPLTGSARLKAMRSAAKLLAPVFGKRCLKYFNHHHCHAASAFYLSGFDKAAVLVIDGRGETEGTSFWQGAGQKLSPLGSVRIPHSLGLLFAAITDQLGFSPYSDEWKVMGMAAYGTDALEKDFARLVRQDAQNGNFRLDMKYFGFQTHGRARWVSPRFCERFGPRRNGEEKLEQRHFDLARALQKTVEKAGLELAAALRKKTGLGKLCIAGGVALNCLMNARIAAEAGFEKVFVQPAAHDAGAALGAALLAAGKNARPRTQIEHVYWGSEFNDRAAQKCLETKNIPHRYCENPAAQAAKLLAEGKIVGWFQGRMEAGPRALGNRSMLASPRDTGMRERLNRLIKKREFFRPFAPAVPLERAAEYFALDPVADYAFMTQTAGVRAEKKEEIPAVVHADGTARVQTVERKQNPRFHELLTQFGRLTGTPVLLNTSFNENEPIVCTPEQAADCYLRTELDVLVIGNFVCQKEPSGT